MLTAKARERLSHVLESDDVVTIVGPDEVGPGQSTAPGNRLVWHFVADMVNDFAWATASNYVWRATRATIPGKGPIPIHMVYRPDHANLYANAGQVARHALEFYSKLWAPYPFPQLTLQDGPSAGMEYPMVINSNQGAADHETGHQWWPMMVGTNETWYGWMDEGFNQYMNVLSGADSRHVAPNLNGLGQSYGRTSGNEEEASMMWPANNAGSMYTFQTYSKTPLMLSMLGGIVGDTEVQRAMSEYTKAWSFKHPSPWDYIAFMNKALGQDLNWFWYYWLWTTESVDGSIADVSTSGTRADRDGPAGRADAVAGRAEGPVRRVRGEAEGDPERENRRRHHCRRHLSRGRLVQRQPDVQDDDRLRAPDRHDHARPRLPVPGPHSRRQRLAEGRRTCVIGRIVAGAGRRRSQGRRCLRYFGTRQPRSGTTPARLQETLAASFYLQTGPSDPSEGPSGRWPSATPPGRGMLEVSDAWCPGFPARALRSCFDATAATVRPRPRLGRGRRCCRQRGPGRHCGAST